MKVLSLYGSPHKKGFTSQIHDIFCESLSSDVHEVVRTYKYQVKPCIACGKCENKPVCKYDDMIDIYESIRQATHIVISSPLYFSSVPAVMKNYIDRCQVLWEEAQRTDKPFVKKKAQFISTGGSDYKEMFLGAEIPVRHLFATLGAEYNRDDFIYLKGCDRLDMLPDTIVKRTRELSRIFFS